MKIKTQDLRGAQLDWAVAKCEGYIDDWNSWLHEATVKDVAESGSYHPSTDWSIGGPIIEREDISVEFGRAEFKSEWIAYKLGEPHEDNPEGGPTPLVAAMRCFVASKLGEEVEVPDELSAI